MPQKITAAALNPLLTSVRKDLSKAGHVKAWDWDAVEDTSGNVQDDVEARDRLEGAHNFGESFEERVGEILPELGCLGNKNQQTIQPDYSILRGYDLQAVTVPKKERKRPRRVPAMLLMIPAISVAMAAGSVGSWRDATGGTPALMASVAFLNEAAISTKAPLMAATGASISASLENGLICSTFVSIGRR